MSKRDRTGGGRVSKPREDVTDGRQGRCCDTARGDAPERVPEVRHRIACVEQEVDQLGVLAHVERAGEVAGEIALHEQIEQALQALRHAVNDRADLLAQPVKELGDPAEDLLSDREHTLE